MIEFLLGFVIGFMAGVYAYGSAIHEKRNKL